MTFEPQRNLVILMEIIISFLCEKQENYLTERKTQFCVSPITFNACWLFGLIRGLFYGISSSWLSFHIFRWRWWWKCYMFWIIINIMHYYCYSLNMIDDHSVIAKFLVGKIKFFTNEGNKFVLYIRNHDGNYK